MENVHVILHLGRTVFFCNAGDLAVFIPCHPAGSLHTNLLMEFLMSDLFRDLRDLQTYWRMHVFVGFATAAGIATC